MTTGRSDAEIGVPNIKPLFRTENGANVTRGALVIRDGHTHHHQDVKEHLLFLGGLENPPRIVGVDGSGEITLNAIDWLAEENIALIRLHWDGRLLTTIRGGCYSADPAKSAWQLAARANDADRVQFSLPLIRQKIEGTLTNLATYLPASRSQERSIRVASEILDRLAGQP